MTPRAYASALGGESGGTLRFAGSAPGLSHHERRFKSTRLSFHPTDRLNDVHQLVDRDEPVASKIQRFRLLTIENLTGAGDTPTTCIRLCAFR